MGLPKHRYQRVSISEMLAEEPESPGEKSVPTRFAPGEKSWLSSPVTRMVIVAVLTAIVTALCSGYLLSKRMAHAPTPAPTNETETSKEVVRPAIKHCGSSPSEARALGCVYDVMMQLWTPLDCYDGVLSERYLAKNNWTWYADSGAEHIMSDEEMALGEHTVIYVAQDYHVQHCIFAWERVVRALRTQGPLIEELISYDHVIHCRDHTLLPALDITKHIRGVVAPTGYTKCAPYDVWLAALPDNEHSSVD